MILNIFMLDKTGKEAYKEIRNINPAIKTIILRTRIRKNMYAERVSRR